MSHDHDALHLAVASLDFELSPQEQARMQAGLLECAECAEAASSHNELGRILGRLPVSDASPYVRERVLRAALVPPRDRSWPVLLAAAALLGLMLAAAAAAGAFREPQLLDTVVGPTASLPALGDLASTEPSRSPEPGATDPAQGPGGLSNPGVPLAPDTLAEVVSGRLRIRSEPRVAGDSIKYEPLLDVGDHLLILDGPVVANDYEWYQVAAWRPGNLYEAFPTGWIARGDHDGTAWMRPRADPCPTGTITMEQIVALHPEERVACFGDRPHQLRAFVSGGPATSECVPEPEVACVDGPGWLTDYGGWHAQSDVMVDTPSIGGPTLAIDPNGAVPVSALPSGNMIDLEGAFDHPTARECRSGLAGPRAPALAATAARLSCRSRFVVTRVNVDPMYPVQDGAAVTVSGNLRVRSDPGLASERHELVPNGTAVWVVDGPVVAADYEWFRVVVPSIDVGDGVPRIGWVAASDHGGERWLARRPLDCPDRSSTNIADLVRLTSPGDDDGGLACFGRSAIRFEGTIGLLCGVEDRPGWEMTPEWLSGNAYFRLTIRDGDAVVVGHPRPDLELPVACGGADQGGRYLIEAHFDDAAASGCVAQGPGASAAPALDRVTTYWCRTTLVIDRLVPAAKPT